MQNKSLNLSGKSLLAILSIAFLDNLAFGLIIPIVPILFADPNSPHYLLPSGYSVQQGYILYGWLVAFLPLCQFLAAPVLGQLSDKRGRKIVLGVSLAGTLFGFILFGIGIITKNIPLLFLSRGLDGVTAANIAVAQSAIADITPPEERAKNFGLYGAVFALGYITGPLIGGALSDSSVVSWFSAATPFWFGAVLGAVNIILVVTWLPETNIHINKELKVKWSRSLSDVAYAYTYKGFRALFTSVFLFQGGVTLLITFIGVYLVSQFQFTSSDIGYLLAYVSLWIVISQGLIVRKLTRFADYKILRTSLVVSGLFVLVIFLATVPWQLFLAATFIGIGGGVASAFLPTIVSRSASQSNQGEILGINSSVSALAQSIPPIISGYLAAEIFVQVPIYVASLFVVLSGILLWLFYKPDY